MGGFSGSDGLGDSGVIELIGKIVVIAIVLLLFVVVFAFCVHIYARWAVNRRRETDDSTTTTRRRRRFDFAGGHQEEVAVPRRGLDPSVLKTIPITAFNRQERSKDGLECAVCLGEVSGGEKVRVLPECRHGFHVDCIDTWFKSHSTCPICRNLVSGRVRTDPIGEVSGLRGNVITTTTADSANFPTNNVLVWGGEEESHDQPSSSSSPPSTVVVDIPRQSSEEDGQGLKSPALTRLRSLKRLFSGNNRRVSNAISPRNLDLEEQKGAEDKSC